MIQLGDFKQQLRVIVDKYYPKGKYEPDSREMVDKSNEWILKYFQSSEYSEKYMSIDHTVSTQLIIEEVIKVSSIEQKNKKKIELEIIDDIRNNINQDESIIARCNFFIEGMDFSKDPNQNHFGYIDNIQQKRVLEKIDDLMSKVMEKFGR
ncbi:unnamed protein product [Rhizophagus irregularis]|uniref:Uncharacterized protein n=1 Tax=Rhizophagus irregularis TaxID=588596 RepID=A0A2N1MZB4_9GLOM|nr:hypothetical protein RhiirC2_714450 [Rhizophagus irregularis]CAB4395009.1 unnamed protein product [Rhizophagus irregularis]CAB5359305.1 unnamed protein product [Rhizophagus irregularis]